MPNPATVSTVSTLVLLPLIAWRVYARVRRLVGRQKLSRVRPWLTLVFFPLLLALLGLTALSHPERLLLLAGGVAGGLGLARYGLSKTRFEATPQGLFYTPNAHLGIALSLLFIGRLAYRFIELYLAAPGLRPDAADFGRSPLTLAIFGLLAGYYVGYAFGLLRWKASLVRLEAPPHAPEP